MMPKQNKRPTTFQSDDEDDDIVVNQQGPQSSSLDFKDPKPTASQQPGRLKRVLTLQDDDNIDNMPLGLPEEDCRPSIISNKRENTTVNIAELVAILSQSNANLKGKVDDTGRFELEFELNASAKTAVSRRRARHERTPSPTRSDSTSGSPSVVKKQPGRRIGWIK